MPSSGGGVRAPPQALLAAMVKDTANNAKESGAKIMVHRLVRWWLAEVGCQRFCRAAPMYPGHQERLQHSLSSASHP